MARVLFEAKVISWGGVKFNLLGLVQALQSEPILCVPRCIAHCHQLSARTILEITKVFTLLGVHHGIILRHDQHKLVQRLEVLLVGSILVSLDLIVDVRQKVSMSPVLPQILCITIIVCLCQAILHEGRVDPCMGDNGIHRAAQNTYTWHAHGALWQAINAHQNTMHGEERLHWRIVVLVDVTTNHCVSLGETNCIETSAQLFVSTHHTCKLVHLPGRSNTSTHNKSNDDAV